MRRSTCVGSVLALMMVCRIAGGAYIDFGMHPFLMTSQPVHILDVTLSESGTGGLPGLESNHDWTSRGFSGGAANDERDRSFITVRFDSPVNHVTLRAGAGDLQTWTMSAYNVDGQLLDSDTRGNGPDEPVLFDVQSTAAIDYVTLVESPVGRGGYVTMFDDLFYEVVPEPSASMLLVLLMGGMTMRRRPWNSGRAR